MQATIGAVLFFYRGSPSGALRQVRAPPAPPPRTLALPKPREVGSVSGHVTGTEGKECSCRCQPHLHPALPRCAPRNLRPRFGPPPAPPASNPPLSLSLSQSLSTSFNLSRGHRNLCPHIQFARLPASRLRQGCLLPIPHPAPHRRCSRRHVSTPCFQKRRPGHHGGSIVQRSVSL